MPELPEVETARKVIAERALHRTIVAVDDTDSYVCRPHAPGQIRDALLGRQLIAAHRRGKTMWCETSGLDGSADHGSAEHGSAEHGSAEHGPDLGLHLGMAGRIVVESPGLETAWGGEPFRRDAQPARAQWDRFRLDFADGGSLVLFDKRRLSRVRLNPGLAALGPDAGTVTEAEFRDLVRRGTVAVKARLLDQSKIAGVGNLLADEALWQARISPQAPAGSLSRPAVSRLYRSLQAALASAEANGGVHTGEVIAARRRGGVCPRCGAPMRRGVVGGRTTWWCSREQALRRAAGARAPGRATV
ncbi:MAG TPA: DNA-formamidopyrimidine glycosylase family protein [Streptosporangiaceae bacterium]